MLKAWLGLYGFDTSNLGPTSVLTGRSNSRQPFRTHITTIIDKCKEDREKGVFTT